MDIYYEQNVVNQNIDERTKKTKTLVIAKMICLIIGLFILVSSALLISFFWVFLIMAIPFFIAFWAIGYINKRNNTEYDYVIDGEFINITAIYFRERRKPKYKIRLRLVESVGVFDSEGYKKIERTAAKKHLALVNYDDEQSILYVLYNSDKGKHIIFLEPDRGFMIALRRCVAAITVFDKSITELEKRLTQKESDTMSVVKKAVDNVSSSKRSAEIENAKTDDDIDNTSDDTVPEKIDNSETEDNDKQ